MSNSHRDRAHRHLQNVQALRLELLEAYRKGSPAHLIAQLHQDIGASMKLAQVHADLATADAVDDLRAELVEALRRRADVILDAS